MSAEPSWDVIVVGAGGHGRVLVDTLLVAGVAVAGVVDPGLPAGQEVASGVPVLGDDSCLADRDRTRTRLVNGLGSAGDTALRRAVHERLTGLGFEFCQVLHPSAVVSPGASLAADAQVLAGCVVATGARVGENSILNHRCSVDHDCDVGAHVHLAPGVTLSGAVVVEDGAHLGTGAVVIQGCTVGRGALVAAGSVVYRDVPAGERLVQTRTWRTSHD